METPPERRHSGSRKTNLPAVAFFGKCPRCSDGQIFNGFLKLAPQCEACGFDLAPFQQGDGPAFFVILVAGTLMTPLGLWLANTFNLSGVSFLAVISVLVMGTVLILLRLAKALLVGLQYRQDAREGRLDQ